MFPRTSPFSKKRVHSIRPLYSPDSKKIAFLEQTKVINTKDTLYNLVYWDIGLDTIYTVCTDKKVQSFNWSKNGSSIYYSSGTNIVDINVFELYTEKTVKLNTANRTGNEFNPRPYKYLDQNGVLFNYQQGENHYIYWQSLNDGQIFNLIDQSGSYYLP